ncbi:hypothetical protein GS500_21080 [Rhodococcus hoagii]|uniref:hypothetical protein n=1 Tax=Rhodococcus hoagii TaxID=43767 RepID=UPI001A0DEB9E|nr:hypothetical protein [Prescottella equi]NKS55232.1 hypothetical protein [Prescottella equi]BCN65392.1 hypothetical protein RE9431_38470 [Prescottella equi]BCN75236.1 hypothetical protein RE0327_38350 [Prescottella equi]
MTEPEGDSQAISVAELLARNGQRVGAGGGGRRRRGVKGGISVAELTGEFQAVRAATPETPDAETPETQAPDTQAPEATTPETKAPAAEAPVDDAPAPETPAVESTAVAEPEKKPESSDEKGAKDSKDSKDANATVAFSSADAVAARKDADAADKADENTDAAGKDAAAKAEETPTLISRAVEADDHKFDSGWRSAATTVLEPVPAQPLAHSVDPEPRLLSGQSVAGDLLRRNDAAAPAQADAGAADTDLDDDSPADPEDLPEEASAAKQWAVLLGQGAVAVVAGALMFKGFEKLWDMLPMVALILAVLVIVGLVAMVRILRRTDDIASLVIAVVAGVFVTLGPLAFLLSTS